MSYRKRPDLANPLLARQILDTYREARRGEAREDGERRLYRFPVVFTSDHWPTVMPHQLAVWGAREKHFWSQYSSDGRTRQCWCPAPVPDEQATRPIRSFGGLRPVLPSDNNG